MEQDQFNAVIVGLNEMMKKNLGESKEAWRGFFEAMSFFNEMHTVLDDDVAADRLIGYFFVGMMTDPLVIKLYLQYAKDKRELPVL